MKVNAYLFISRDGSLRITKRDPRPTGTELGVQVVIDVPDVFFNRPIPKVDVSIPKEFLVNPKAEIVAKMIAPELADSLSLEVKTVEDGLLTMLKEHLPEGPAE